MVEHPQVVEFSFDGIRYLIKDHEKVKSLFNEYLNGTNTSQTHKRQLVKQFTTEIVKHASSEERYLYPILLEKMGNEQAKLLYNKNLLDDLITKEMLRFFETSVIRNDFDWHVFDKAVRKFIEMELHHIEEEEKDVFPIIRQSLNEEELATLEDAIKWAKDHGPTHPHPMESMTNPQAAITHPVTGRLDRLRDEREQNAMKD
ncbi:predicted protein [Naegleria gruberi]|uniref:Predicted protein n=1 Tax=Naegleria gruberi TaxID=5762 RepID=D2VHD4_NAEGR|nr:uncharacterized protein NAEGRDRAFT_68177 [Naegleria gruberi]EFC43781.1 predicted protein [Naegleria gruberi]|eukprot:XP_002676525.1 predicted protein [Naegleria gruberi strain NEG-M]